MVLLAVGPISSDAQKARLCPPIISGKRTDHGPDQKQSTRKLLRIGHLIVLDLFFYEGHSNTRRPFTWLGLLSLLAEVKDRCPDFPAGLWHDQPTPEASAAHNSSKQLMYYDMLARPRCDKVFDVLHQYISGHFQQRVQEDIDMNDREDIDLPKILFELPQDR